MNRRSFTIIVAIVLANGALFAAATDLAQRGKEIPGKQTPAHSAESLTLKFTPTLPAISKEEQLRRETLHVAADELEEEVPASGTPILGPAGGETVSAPAPPAGPAPPGGSGPDAPGTFKIWRNSTLSPNDSAKATNEPSVGNNGRYVFYTGNWYAARSVDGGATWGYIDPHADFDLCCDQDVIYDKSRDLLVWFRLGKTRKDASDKDISKFRIGVSTNGGASFCFWNWKTTDFEKAWDLASWDYPQMALSNNHLYFTIVVRSAGNLASRKEYYPVLARASLDTLRSCGNLSWTFWVQDSAAFGCFAASDKKVSRVWTPVHGARETMYLGQTTKDDCFTVWRQREKDTSLEQFRSSVPAWSASRTGLTCPLPGGDPCQRTDSRVRAGWVSRNVVGFFWVAAKGAGFPYPYVEAATFQESDLSRIGRPYIWNKTHAWVWAAAYPNERGGLGIATWKMGGGLNPELSAGIADDFSDPPPPWDLKLVARSDAPPAIGKDGKRDDWGDYLRVRPHLPAGLAWILSGFVSVGPKANPVAEPHFAIFGRARDSWSVQRWWDQP